MSFLHRIGWIGADGEAWPGALINIGLPGGNVTDGTMLLSLMRSTHINDYVLSLGQPASSGPQG